MTAAAVTRAPAQAAPLRAVDEVLARRDGARLHVTATIVVPGEGAYPEAHFPGRPIYPGVFTLETVCQAVAAGLAALGEDAVQLASLASLRLLAPVLPGDRLTVEVGLERDASGGWDVRALCRVGADRKAAQVAGRFAPDGPGPEDGAGLSPAAVLPHGHPMVLVDRVESVTPGARLRAVKAVSRTEPCYRHLPPDAAGEALAYPVSLLVESFGQAALLLWHATASPGGAREGGAGGGRLPLFAAARDVRVLGRAYPGDVLRHDVRMEHVVADTAFVTGEAWVRERRIVTIGSLVAAVRPAAEEGAPVRPSAFAREGGS